MDRLWAPWRAALLLKPPKGCIFCAIPRASSDRANYLLWRGPKTLVLLNLYPYSNGHLLIAPYRHVARIKDLRAAEASELFGEARRATTILDRLLKPEGYNLGMNIGRAGGAAFAGHAHLHVVPRWIGDTNFMPVVHETKVVGRSLDALYDELKKAYSKR